MRTRWENERGNLDKVRHLREQIEQTKLEIEQAENAYDLQKAAELKYGKLPELEKQLVAEEQRAGASSDASRTGVSAPGRSGQRGGGA